MPSRQDQLHSYQFSVQRVVAALVMRETDPAQSPFRRVAGAMLAGALFAAIAMAGSLVYGLVAGSGVDWRKEGQVLIETDSGTRYVLYNGKLHPAVNYASAVLIAGTAGRPSVERVSRSSLKDAPRGEPIGIDGAPDSVPDAKQLLRTAWTLCSEPPDGNRASGADPRSTLLVGQAPSGGRTMRVRPADHPDAIVVSTPDKRQFLIYDNQRFAIADPLVLTAFGWSTQSVVPVAPALVNALPDGPDLRRVAVTGRGRTSLAFAYARVGQVFEVVTGTGNSQQYAVALADGLAEVSAAEADLLAADPDISSATGVSGTTKLQADRFEKAAKSKNRLSTALPFTVPPRTVGSNGTVCLSIADAGGVGEVRTDARVPGAGALATPARTAGGTVLADRVSVPPGRGALVEAMASKGAQGGALSLVTELGIRYPVAGREVADKLGFGGVEAAPMPAEVVALLPVGPALDPADAVKATSTP
jgi:type VII secretion protein EccB